MYHVPIFTYIYYTEKKEAKKNLIEHGTWNEMILEKFYTFTNYLKRNPFYFTLNVFLYELEFVEI